MTKKWIAVLLTSVLLFRLTVPAIACPPLQCPDCTYEHYGECVPYGDCWGGCPSCESCVECYCDCIAECGCEGKTCPTCESCVACSCECTAECGCEGKTCSGCCTCQNCSCEPDNGECGNCQECNANCDCVKKAGAECEDNSDCEPEEYCCVWPPNCECYCDVGSCWEMRYFPALEEECDECEGPLTHCVDIVEIRAAYTTWVAATIEGYCKDPKKQVTVGHMYQCKPDWDLGEIEQCVGHSMICHYICHAAIHSGHPLALAACALCLVDEAIACASGGICTFVEDCVQGDEVMPIERDVLDYQGDWGNYRTCGFIS